MNEENNQEQEGKYVKIKKFPFIMGIFLLIFATAGITMIALTFGDEKVDSLAPSKYPQFEKLYSTYDTIKEKYYEEVDDEELANGAIEGMLKALGDPYSTYMNEEEAQSFHDQISSSFEGIGAEIEERDGQITVVSPIKGSPAEKVGLRPQDVILTVDGESIEGVKANEAVAKIRGKKGTKVVLTVARAGVKEPITFTITRDTIPIETVYAEMMDDNIAKIAVTSFSEHTVEELKEAITDMTEKDMKGLILDLRGNPGGLLDEAIKMSSLFVPDGEIVLQVEDKSGKREEYRSANNGELKLPVVVLIDNGSASASEIVAGALSESAGIPLVGEKTFGKGTVQNAQDFSDGSNFKFTAYKWLTPKGNWINEKGIKPDYKVSLPSYASLPFLSPSEKLKLSDTSNEVKTAEKMLKALGYDPGKVDGYFDEQTKTAVESLQKDEGLKVTGIIKGDTTIKILEKLQKKLIENDTQVEKAVKVLKKEIK